MSSAVKIKIKHRAAQLFRRWQADWAVRTVHEPISFWENWSKKRFERSGAYALEGALAPVKIDLDNQSGTYEEPNVWVSYGA